MECTVPLFINGTVPHSRLWQSKSLFCVLDTQFGDGSDFWCLTRNWSPAKGECRELHYVAFCGLRFECPSPEMEPFWPLPLPGHHRIPLPHEPHVRLSVVFGDENRALENLAGIFDFILLKKTGSRASDLARVSKHETAIQSGVQKDADIAALERSGFSLQRNASGCHGTFRARKQRIRSGETCRENRDAIIIGAGLAGSAAAASLSRRGWNITVLEKDDRCGNSASGNLAGVVLPMLSKDDGLAARLSRASFLALLQELRSFQNTRIPVKWSGCGVLQLARDEKEETLFKQILRTHSYPGEYVAFLTKDEASKHAGHSMPSGGFLFPRAGWVNPPSLCEARFNSDGISLRTNTAVASLSRVENLWHALDSTGETIAKAPVLVLANAFHAPNFSEAQKLHFKKVRGQVTHVPSAVLPSIACVLSREGYLTPAFNGESSLGATYDFDSNDETLWQSSQLVNLSRLPTFLEGISVDAVPLAGRVGFRTLTADRMPMVGAIPDFDAPMGRALNSDTAPRKPGLYALLGLGSRGVVWSTLAGETLAALIDGEPSPISLDLLNAIDPARFLIREQRVHPSPRAPEKARVTRSHGA